MKITIPICLLILPIILSSCATPAPPSQAYYKIDDMAVVIDSLDANNCQFIHPNRPASEPNDVALREAHTLFQHQTAVVILENYKEAQPGDEFRSRTTALYVGLRNAGYEHVVFLQRKGVSDNEGLVSLADYN